MKNEILCGSACVRYILNHYSISEEKLNQNLFWVPEIALYLYKYFSKGIKIYCFNSTLNSEYKKASNIDACDGFIYIRILEEKGLHIFERKLTEKELLKELKTYEFMIVSVSSAILNNDKQMSGNHYVILKLKDEKIEMINHQKEKYAISDVDPQFIIQCCENCGSWRILLKKEE